MKVRFWCWLMSAALMGDCHAMAAAQPVFPGQPTGTPAPELIFAGQDSYMVGSQRFDRYHFDVLNKWQYPEAMFAPAPSLPPCGNNRNSSRTWVDIYAQDGRRIYGFCALGRSADLGMIWFGLPAGQAPPANVYIEMQDRQTNTKYRSNVARTNR